MIQRSFVFLMLMMTPSLAFSQSLEPRLYLPLPTGRNVLGVSYTHTSGTIVLDAALPVSDSNTTLDAGTLAYVRTFGLFGRSAQVQAISTFVTGEANAVVAGADTTRHLDGPTDPMLRLAVNLMGGPARRLDQLKGVKFGTILGASVSVSVPVGRYEESRYLNLGANRWAVKPEVGVVQPIRTMWALEGYFGVWLFGDNDDYLRTSTASQDPLWTWQAHAIRILGRKGWVALDGTWFRGGVTSVNGVEQNTFTENARLGATAAWFINLRHAVKASFASGVTTRYGGDFDTISVGYQYGWGR